MKLFGGKPDHPMADPKEMRRLLDALPVTDPLKALDELAHWHESVSAADGFRPDAELHVGTRGRGRDERGDEHSSKSKLHRELLGMRAPMRGRPRPQERGHRAI